MVLLIGFGCADRPPIDGAPSVQRLVRANFLLDNAAQPPNVESGTRVSLPHLWSETIPEVEGSGWYQLALTEVDLSAPGYAVYLPKLNMNAAVFVNGQWVGDGGTFEPPVAQNWNRPLYFPFATSLLKPSGNVVQVRVYAYAYDWGGLHPLYVGPNTSLQAAAERQYTFQVTISQIASVIMLLLTLSIGALAIGNSDPVYRFWAAGCFLYFIHSLSAHQRDIGMPYHDGRWLIHTCFDGFIILLILGIHRWAKIERPRFERLLVLFVCFGAALTFFAPDSWFLKIANLLHIVPLVMGAYGMSIMIQHFRKLGGPEAAFTVAAGAITLGLGIHALLIYFELLPRDEPRLLKLMAPVLMIGFGAVLVARYIRSARRAKVHNRELQLRVAERELELRAYYDAEQIAEKEKLLIKERARLMREMHDGMGARLVSLLSVVQQSPPTQAELATSLRGALDELRFIIDSLDPDIGDLGSLLGLVRERAEPSLNAHGLQFRWKVGLVPEGFALGPEQSLDVLRIVQECLTNIIKHADAKIVEIGTLIKDDGHALVLYVADDGGGFEPGQTKGRGMTNLRARADRLGAELTVNSNSEGTRMELAIKSAESGEESGVEVNQTHLDGLVHRLTTRSDR